MAASKKTAEDKVRDAYRQLAAGNGGPVRIADLRYRLCSKGLTFAQQDEVLVGMYKRQEVNLTDQVNAQAITRDQQATAVRVGGMDKHLISIRG